MKQLREEWFANWLKENTEFEQQEILKFHKNDTLGIPATSVKMKRLFVETVSITSVIKENSKVDILYIDFLEKGQKALQDR